MEMPAGRNGRQPSKNGRQTGNTDVNQAKTDATLRELRADQDILEEEMLTKMEADQGRMMARMDSQLEKIEKWGP
jgi:hypothetical protein